MFKLSKDGVSSPTPLEEAYNITNGQVIEFTCATGYNVQGPGNLRCYHGEWTGTSLPECVPGNKILLLCMHHHNTLYYSTLSTATNY